jgi:hypothetical protein
MNWYTTREVVKRALGITGADRDTLVDETIEAVSGDIVNAHHRRYIPKTETRKYAWPQPGASQKFILYLDEDLLSVSSLTKDGSDVTAIASGDFSLEPTNLGPPYSRIELDLSGTAFFSAKDTPQDAIRVTGSWAFSNDTKAAGTVDDSGGINTTDTTLEISDASKVDVGDTLLVETEQLFVSERATKDTTANVTTSLTADASNVTVVVNTGSLVKKGEVILVDSEKMLVTDVTGNNLTVQRAYDGSTLAAHSQPIDVYAYRSLTITRAVNGTTAATHADTTAITKYQPPAKIRELARAEAIAHYTAEKGGWTGVVSAGEAAIETRMKALGDLRQQVRRQYGRRLIGVV